MVVRAGGVAPKRVADMLGRVRACGATDDALLIAREHVHSGLKALEQVRPGPAVDALEALAYHLVERVS